MGRALFAFAGSGTRPGTLHNGRMASITPNPETIRDFPNAAAFERWLKANHNKATELWLKIHKKGSGLPTVTYAEALDVALCWGWIDGIKKTFDEHSFLQRFTPRKAKSLWSQINRQHVARLIEAGRMTPHGMKHVEAAKADGRWQAAYASPSKTEPPPDLLAALDKAPKAKAHFAKLNSTNRYAICFRLHNTKTAAARAKKLAAFIAMLAKGQQIHPQ